MEKDQRKPATLYLEEPLEFPTMAKCKLVPGIEVIKHINRLFNLAFKDYFGAKLEVEVDGTVNCLLYFKLGYDNGKNGQITAFERITLETFNKDKDSNPKKVVSDWTSRMRMHNQIVKEFNCQNSTITQDAVDILYSLIDFRILADPAINLKPTAKSFKDKGICLETVFDSQNPLSATKDVYNVVKFISVNKVMNRLYCKKNDKNHEVIVQRSYIMAKAANDINRQLQNNPNVADILPANSELNFAYEICLYDKNELIESARSTDMLMSANPNGIITDM